MEMTLLGSAVSPYTARVRLMIYARALPVAIAEPPGGLRSAELRARNPLGKVPVLELRAPGEAPRYLPESGAILDYLEEAFAERPLRPADAWGRARERALMRCAELLVDRAVFPLFRALLAAAPAPPRAEIAEMREALQMLDALLRHFAGGATAGAAQPGAGADADARADAAAAQANAGVPAALSLADCALLPSLFYALRLAEAWGEADVLRGLGALRARWEWLEAQPAAAKVLGELDSGFRALRQRSAQ